MPIKLLGTVPAGFPSPASDYMEDRLDLTKELIQRPHSTFLFRVSGESMTGAFIPPNALLVVDRMEKVKNGSIVVAVLAGEFTVKRLLLNGVTKLLSPENDRYKPIELTGDTPCEIWGVATYIITNAREV